MSASPCWQQLAMHDKNRPGRPPSNPLILMFTEAELRLRELDKSEALRLQHLDGSVLEGEDGDVVFLSELLGGAGDLFGGLGGDGGGAVEAEELAGGRLGLYYAIG